MDLMHALWLAILQGVTEFLPISSSGHLILAPVLFGWQDQGLAFDVAVHFGTLAAVVYYFRHDVVTMTRAWLASLGPGPRSADSDLAWCVIWGTVPAVIAGAALAGQVATLLRSPFVIAAATGGFGIVLWIADARGERYRDVRSISWRDALLIGLAQALALVPGTSRSGITMTAGLLLGLTREASARFSFLLSMPLILAAAVWELLALVRDPPPADWVSLAVGAVVSGVVAYATIRLFLAWLGRVGMAPFAIYRLLLAALLYLIYV